jgi:hypothetical protein
MAATKRRSSQKKSSRRKSTSRKSTSRKSTSRKSSSRKTSSRKTSSSGRCKKGFRRDENGACVYDIQEKGKVGPGDYASYGNKRFVYADKHLVSARCPPGTHRNQDNGICESDFDAEQNARQLSAIKKNQKFEHKIDPNAPMRDANREKRLTSILADNADDDAMGVYKWDSGIRQWGNSIE